MKHLFSIDDMVSDVKKLYVVEAPSEEVAKQYFVKKFSPLFDIEYEALVEGVSQGLEIFIDYIGSIDQIKEI